MSAQIRMEALKLAVSQFDDPSICVNAAAQYAAFIEGGAVPKKPITKAVKAASKMPKERKPRKKEDFVL